MFAISFSLIFVDFVISIGWLLHNANERTRVRTIYVEYSRNTNRIGSEKSIWNEKRRKKKSTTPYTIVCMVGCCWCFLCVWHKAYWNIHRHRHIATWLGWWIIVCLTSRLFTFRHSVFFFRTFFYCYWRSVAFTPCLLFQSHDIHSPTWWSFAFLLFIPFHSSCFSPSSSSSSLSL